MKGLEGVFNREVVEAMSFDNFIKLAQGNSYLAKHRIDIKDAFKFLGGKLEGSKKVTRKSK